MSETFKTLKGSKGYTDSPGPYQIGLVTVQTYNCSEKY